MRATQTFDPGRHRLVRHVSARHPATGYVHSFGPGDDVPDWAATMITNPDVWNGEATEHRGRPPTSGIGAGRDEWAEYARTQGIDVPDDWKRGDIIAAVDQAHKPR